jgi:hypothetical protein
MKLVKLIVSDVLQRTQRFGSFQLEWGETAAASVLVVWDGMEAVILNGGRQQKTLLHFFGCVLGGKGGLQLLTMLES